MEGHGVWRDFSKTDTSAGTFTFKSQTYQLVETSRGLVFINNPQNTHYVPCRYKNTTYSSFKTLFNELVVALSGMWCSSVPDYHTASVSSCVFCS